MTLNYIKISTFFAGLPFFVVFRHHDPARRLWHEGAMPIVRTMDISPTPETAPPHPADSLRRRRLERLLRRLPTRGEQAMRWLLQPGRAPLRFVLGSLLIIGGVLSFLPILGLWMLPLGVILLSEDVPLFRRASARMLEWIERRHPNWLAPETGPTP